MKQENMIHPPQTKPSSPKFCIGPTRKFPGYKNSVQSPWLGRSHRAPDFIAHVKEVIESAKRFLQIPKDYRLLLLDGGATLSVESAFWNFLGSRPIHLPIFDFFGKNWATDIESVLKLPQMHVYETNHRTLPDIPFNAEDDYVIVVGGSTSGMIFTPMHKIPNQRKGLVIADLTSVVGSDFIDWKKIDAGCFSVQKSLNGEGGLGVLVLSPHAIEHLQSYTPSWPIPKMLNFTKLLEMPEGNVNNTPPILTIEDFKLSLDSYEALATDSQSALEVAVQKSEHNVNVIEKYVQTYDFIEFNPLHKEDRLLGITALRLLDKNGDLLSRDKVMQILTPLHDAHIAYDLIGHKLENVVSIRIATSAHIPPEDIDSLMQWIVYEYQKIFT